MNVMCSLKICQKKKSCVPFVLVWETAPGLCLIVLLSRVALGKAE